MSSIKHRPIWKNASGRTRWGGIDLSGYPELTRNADPEITSMDRDEYWAFLRANSQEVVGQASVSAWSRLKVLKLKHEGEEYDFWPLIIDIPVRFSLVWIENRVQVILSSSIEFDGISLRRFDTRESRTYLRKNKKKWSLKNNTPFVNKEWDDIRESVLKSTGLWFLTPIMSLYKTVTKDVDGKNSFWADVHFWWNHELNYLSHMEKHHRSESGVPIIFSQCILDFQEDVSGNIEHRVGIPISWLSRDQANKIDVRTKMAMEVCVDGVKIWSFSFDEHLLHFESLVYRTLATSGIKSARYHSNESEK